MSTAVLKKQNVKYRRLRDQQAGYFLHNRVTYLHQGPEFFNALKDLIDRAKSFIHLQTYIFLDDDTGRFIGDALMAAAKRGVEVYIIVDGYASKELSRDYIIEMTKAGVHFRFFEPFFKTRHFYFGRRMHHKIVVVDGKEGMVGSMNIADKYNDIGNEKAWLDRALHIEGEVVSELQRVCVRFWEGKKWRRVRLKATDTKAISFPESFNTAIRVRQNDWINRKGQATSSYFQLFHNAKESIVVICSYVLPGKNLRVQLERAAKRGVKISFVLAGKSDVKVVKAAERYLYRWMFRNNMVLYEYQPCVLHAKMGMADDEILTMGSYNLNNLSAYASVELNVDVKDQEFVKLVHADIKKVIKKDCREVDLSEYTTRMFSIRQFKRWASYQLTRIAEKIVTKP